jgi:hypothetical protein
MKFNYLIARLALSLLLCILFMGVACCQPINNHVFYPGEYSNSSVIGISLPGTWRPFSDDSPWNIPIKMNPVVHPGSEIIMQRITRTAANIVTTPFISTICGNYNHPVAVTITVNKVWPDAQVYYTLDGSDPTALSRLYTGPFLLSANAVVKAKAYDSNGFPSHIMKAPINIKFQ